MNKRSAYDVYLSVVYKWGILLLVCACMCAAAAYTLLKAVGLFPMVPWAALIIFDIMDIGFLLSGIMIIRTSLQDGYLKEGRLESGKIFSTIILVVQWNYILYMNPSRTFWGFLFFFIVLIAFFLDIRMVIINGTLCIISLVAAWVIRGSALLPVQDEIFITDMINCIIALFLSLLGIIAFVFFMTHFLINAKKDELEENNRRVEQVLNSAQNLCENLMRSGQSLASISESESASSEQLAATSETLLENNNQLSDMSKESMDNLQELIRWGREVNRNVKKVENISKQLIDMSQENEQMIDSLQQININVVQSIHETSVVAGKLTKAVEEIDSTLQMINEISDSTNLLALNASIEAARAGESGKGFAVVAGEVGKLAGNTQESLVGVQNIISNVKQSVREMTDFVEDNSKQLEVQNESFQKVFKALHEMIGLLHASMNDIRKMGETHEKQSEVIDQTIQINERIAERISNENGDFTNISDMADKNANDLVQMSGHITEINNMVEDINKLLNM